MDISNIKISAFRNMKSQHRPVTISLYEWLTTSKYKDRIEALRNCTDAAVQANMKLELPVCIPSGTFDENLKLIQHSGFIAIDVDAKDNPSYSPEQIKEKMCSFANVLFCGYSCRGKGVWALIPLLDPTRHFDHFKALEVVFLKMGIVIDNSCHNVNRLRFCSYDSEPYFNYNASVFSLVMVEEKKPKISLKSPDYIHVNNVFDNFNLHGDIVNLLTNHGWTYLKEKNDRVYFSRPDKAGKGVSGNYHTGLRLFTTWSSSTVFEAKKAYNPSQMFNILECNSDWKQAAKKLKQLNF